MSRGNSYINSNRTCDYLSVKIYDEDLIQGVELYSRIRNLSRRTFIEQAIKEYINNHMPHDLEKLSKEELIRLINSCVIQKERK